MEARKKICNQLAVLTNKLPFFAFYAFDWKIVEAKGIGTFATDLEHLFYDPEVLEKWDNEKIYFVLLHEIVHCIFLHPGTFGRKRMGKRNSYIWNLACEYVANAEAREACGLSKNELPEDAYYDERFEGKTTEEVYEILEKEIKDFKLFVPIKTTVGKDGVKVECTNCGADLKEKDIKQGKCPSCEKDLQTRGKFLDIHLPQEAKEKIQEAIERIIAAHQVCKQKGNLPEGIERQINKLKQAQVPWERILHRIVGQVIAEDDYRWENPNHRHPLADRFILPGLRNEKVGEIVVAIDTSGSIGTNELDAFASEMRKLHSLVEEILVITCDCEIYEMVKTRNVHEFLRKLKFKGGGGTNFNPVFEKLKEMKEKPSLLVYFTDGYGDYPKQKASFPMLWVLTENHQEPPWGYKAVINTD
jgi:predicted metal-dependent peptidase